VGTYHSIASTAKPKVVVARRKTRRPRHNPTQATVDNVLETLILNPSMKLTTASRNNGLGGSTVSNWLKAYPNKNGLQNPVINTKVLDWLVRDVDDENNLIRLAKARPNLLIGQAVHQAVTDALMAMDKASSSYGHLQDVVRIHPKNTGLITEQELQEQVAETNEWWFNVREQDLKDSKDLPTQLNELRNQAVKAKDEARDITQGLQELVIALDMVEDWISKEDALSAANARIQALEEQLKALDDVKAKLLRERVYASQVHSTD
jgi:soluble cytochrome b562